MQSSQQSPLFDQQTEKKQGPVECLGLTFENDEARRAYFIERLREKLQDPEFRKIEGFPIGEDEDILRLSDPPYYTACPNPFLLEILPVWQKERQAIRMHLGLSEQSEQREPFAVDVSEGKTDPLYTAHSYYTKVPHKIIMHYVLQYTEPGDIIFDGFCGTGMTGIASQMCGNRKEIESLGYRIDNNGLIWDKEKAVSQIGVRKTVLNDLSPAATFIAYNYNTPVNVTSFGEAARLVLHEVEKECGWMYETLHTDEKTKCRINYTVWSDIFACPNCTSEIVFSEAAVNEGSDTVQEEFSCPHCQAKVTKRDLELLFESRIDPVSGDLTQIARRKPVLINYTYKKNKCEKKPDKFDLETLRKIEELDFPSEIPQLNLPDMQMARVGRMKTVGITKIRDFFLARQAQSLASLWRNARKNDNPRIRGFLLFFVEQAVWGLSVLNRYSPTHFSQVNRALSGVFYIASQISEVSPWYNLEGKLGRIVSAFEEKKISEIASAISTENLGSFGLPENSIDYIFTDPPFGENIYYSDLNILVESWHNILTTPITEAIIDRVRGKDFEDYQKLMRSCFKTYYQALKPGCWMTVEFHNSKNAIWNAIQFSLQQVGFVVADVRILSKESRSFQQVNSANAVKQDLVISAYKPKEEIVNRSQLSAGNEESVWEFVHFHLGMLPILNRQGSGLAINQERQAHMLFDRMVAFHVRYEILVPISLSEFLSGLGQRFPERDGMYFLPDQVGEYDQARLNNKQIQQLQFFVSDESSAILWLRQLLENHPQTYQDLFPKFIREINAWEKYEKSLELSEILEQNFLSYDGTGVLPKQIWAWMQRDEEAREAIKGQNREIPSNSLIALAKGRWFVPDTNNAQQLEKVREKALLREFEGYKSFPGKKLKVFRLEAVRAGFKKAWQEQDYKTIIAIADKISEDALQEDPKLLMWYDQALTRMEL